MKFILFLCLSLQGKPGEKGQKGEHGSPGFDVFSAVKVSISIVHLVINQKIKENQTLRAHAYPLLYIPVPLYACLVKSRKSRSIDRIRVHIWTPRVCAIINSSFGVHEEYNARGIVVRYECTNALCRAS